MLHFHTVPIQTSDIHWKYFCRNKRGIKIRLNISCLKKLKNSQPRSKYPWKSVITKNVDDLKIVFPLERVSKSIQLRQSVKPRFIMIDLSYTLVLKIIINLIKIKKNKKLFVWYKFSTLLAIITSDLPFPNFSLHLLIYQLNPITKKSRN